MLPDQTRRHPTHRYSLGHPPQVHLSDFRVTRWHISFAIVMAVFGLALSIQWHSQQSAGASGQEVRTDPSTATIRRLEDEQKSLKATVADLQRKVQEAQQDSSASQAINAVGSPGDLQRELDRQRLLAGLVPIKGSGVKVVLDDSTKTPLPEDNPNNYIVHDYELRDVTNLLWSGGAYAIAINGERLTSISSVFCVGTTILVNDTRMSPPYEIAAIGDSATLEEIVNNPVNLRKLKTAARLYGVQLKVSRVKDLQLPAFDGALRIRYATVKGN
ncbi:MAG: DUF881 domain-containing protein [Chloroflexota bacterium]|nr:MAG: DUF881 domain-containing protein [Chloroflexota bacterium]